MKSLPGALVCAAVLFSCHGQDLSKLDDILTFEAPQSGSTPAGWSGSAKDVFLDDRVVHSGKWSVRIERDSGSAGDFSTITKSIPIEFTGKTIELHGFICTDTVSGFVALWIREDGESGPLGFDSLQSQQIRGTANWKEYSVSVRLHPDARQLFFGFLVSGTGRGWVDDMRLLVDGKPISEAPKVEPPKTVLDTDHEFDAGSKITVSQLSTVQIDNLAALAKVWGLLKYHHPAVTSGTRHWDYDLFRIMPAILAARDAKAANAELVRWVSSLGPIGDCSPCANLNEADLHFRPEIAWIRSAALGTDLTRALDAVYRNRPANGKQFYVSLTPGVGNPLFQHEQSYAGLKLPDAGYQLLALYRFWNIIRYWFPYRDVLNEDWDAVLVEFIPRLALASSADAYQRELMSLIARAHDTHANLWSGLQARPPIGTCRLPVIVRFIEGRPVVAGYADTAAGPATGLKPGDILESLDDVPVAQLITRWKPYYAASNEPTIMRDIARSMTNGDCVDTRVRVRRGSESFDLTAKRVRPASGTPASAGATHDLPGDTFRLLSTDVAYLKLSSVKAAEAASYIDRATGTKGLIIDIRNYPSEFMVFALGSLLVDKPTPFARFTQGDLANPGAFHFGPPIALSPGKVRYPGKIAILIDEVSQSQAEYTTMAFRSVPNAFVVGSTTAGADGNVSPIPLPGNQRSMISGIGVFYPDKRPTQRVGIIPDLEARPTIAGIRDGRDEVLEAALSRILGTDVPAAEIQKLARPDGQ